MRAKITASLCAFGIFAGAALAQPAPVPDKPSGPDERFASLPVAVRLAIESALRSERRQRILGFEVENMFPLPVCSAGKCGAVNRDGTFAIDLQYQRVYPFYEGIAIVRAPHRSSYQYGYVDQSGRVVFRPQFETAGRFERGFAHVDFDGHSGLIDKDGQIALWPRFGFAMPFTSDLFWVTEERDVREGSTGERYFRSDPFSMGFNNRFPTVVGPKGKWGLVDRRGAWIRQPEFLDVAVFDRDGSKGMWAKTDAGWGLLKSDLSWQVTPQYEHVSRLENGLAAVGVAQRWGFVDETGQVVIEPKFEMVRGFAKPYAPVKMNNRFGLIDRTGTWVLEPVYDVLYSVSYVLPRSWWVTKSGDKFGLLNSELSVVLSPQLDQPPTMCEDGTIIARIDKQWRNFDRNGAAIEGNSATCASDQTSRQR